MANLAEAGRRGGPRTGVYGPDLVAPFSLAVPSDECFWLVRSARGQRQEEASLLWDWLVAGRDTDDA